APALDEELERRFLAIPRKTVGGEHLEKPNQLLSLETWLEDQALEAARVQLSRERADVLVHVHSYSCTSEHDLALGDFEYHGMGHREDPLGALDRLIEVLLESRIVLRVDPKAAERAREREHPLQDLEAERIDLAFSLIGRLLLDAARGGRGDRVIDCRGEA